jgi:nucleoside 2-deoxyribosyltransferase
MTRRTAHRAPLVYVAAPLFSDAERSYNIFLKHLLEEYCRVYLPQEDGFLMSDLLASGLSAQDASKSVFDNDIEALKKCDVLLIVLDGRAVDEGAALELGYAYALGKTCVSLQTDFRRLAPFGNNPMIVGAANTAFLNTEELRSWIKEFCFSHTESSATR